MFIYKITNKINNSSYVGQTINGVEKRWMAHCSKRSCCRKLKNAIKKYGKDSFIVETIDIADSLEELNKKEEFWIKQLSTLHPNGYNLIEGGKNRKPTLETRLKRSKSMMGLKRGKRSPEHAEKIASQLRGRKQKPDIIQKRAKHCCKMIVDCTTSIMYNSIKEAADTLGIQRTNISMNLKGNKESCGSRVFQYHKEWDGLLTNKQFSKGIGKYQNKLMIDVNTGIIYDSYQDAADKLNLNKDSLRVLMKKGKPVKGFLFKHVQKSFKKHKDS